MATLSRAHDLRSLSADELVGKLRASKEELFNLRFQSATGQLESHGGLKSVRRDIARIYTVMRERELGISATPDGEPATGSETDQAAAAPAQEETA